MTGTGFVLTPDGQTWLDVGLIAGITYEDADPSGAEPYRAYVLGPEEMRLGEWETVEERHLVISEWLIGVCVARLGIPDDRIEVPASVEIVRSWSGG